MKSQQILLLIIALLGTYLSSGQTTKMTTEEFNSILNTQFTSIVTNGSINAPGNYAAFSEEDGTVSLTGSLPDKKNNRIWSLKVEGQSIDGALPVFTNSKFNNGVSLELQHHNLFKSKFDQIESNPEKRTLYERKQKLIKSTFKDKLTQINNYKNSAQHKIKIITQQIDSLNTVILKINQDLYNNQYHTIWYTNLNGALIKIKNHILPSNTNALQAITDADTKLQTSKSNNCYTPNCLNDIQNELNTAYSHISNNQAYTQDLIKKAVTYTTQKSIQHEQQKLISRKKKVSDLLSQKKKDITSINMAIKNYNPIKEKRIIQLERDGQLETLEKSQLDYVLGVKMNWISTRFKIKKSNYALLDSEQILANQIRDTSFVGFEAGAQYSFYKNLKTKSPLFFNLGATLRYSDNTSNLKKLEISDEQQLGENTDSQTRRYVSSKRIVFQGNYKDEIIGGSIYSNLYKYLTDKGKMGIHFNTLSIFLDGEKPIWTADIGLVMAFVNQSKQKSSINIEFFYRLNDIGNVLESDKNLWERNSIGLRLAVPFTF